MWHPRLINRADRAAWGVSPVTAVFREHSTTSANARTPVVWLFYGINPTLFIGEAEGVRRRQRSRQAPPDRGCPKWVLGSMPSPDKETTWPHR